MKILLTNDVATKIRYYTKFAPGEVSGIGRSYVNEEGDVIIDKVVLFKQECTGASTDLDEAEMAKFAYELSSSGENMRDWNVWWHTHGQLAVSWSTTDTNTIASHSTNSDFLVSIVTNKAGKYLGRVDVFPKDLSPFNVAFSGHKIDAKVELMIEGEKADAIKEYIDGLTSDIAEKEKEIAEAKEMLKEAGDIAFEDVELEISCKAEVEEKVSQKKYGQYTGGYGYRSNDYYTDIDKQIDFEDTLDSILFGENIKRKGNGYAEMEEEDEYEDMEDDFVCSVCLGDLTTCVCPGQGGPFVIARNMEDAIERAYKTPRNRGIHNSKLPFFLN